MRRREFIALFGSALASSCAARAQRPSKPKIGVLIISNKEPFWSLLKKGLREVGYIEGENIQFELRSAEGLAANLPTLAAELVRLKVDVIVASPTPCVHAAKAATTDIPIVMVAAGDPVNTGLVGSLSRPGGNEFSGVRKHRKNSRTFSRDPALYAGSGDIGEPTGPVRQAFHRTYRAGCQSYGHDC